MRSCIPLAAAVNARSASRAAPDARAWLGRWRRPHFRPAAARRRRAHPAIGCANLANLLLRSRRAEAGDRRETGSWRDARPGRPADAGREPRTRCVRRSRRDRGRGRRAADALPLSATRRTANREPRPLCQRDGARGDVRPIILTGVLFGAMPAWRASRTDVLISLRDQSRSATSRGGARSVLLGAQVALSLVLLRHRALRP